MDDLFADRAIRDRTLARADIRGLLGAPQILAGCDLEGADLSGLDLSDWTFERCALRKADLRGAELERTR